MASKTPTKRQKIAPAVASGTTPIATQTELNKLVDRTEYKHIGFLDANAEGCRLRFNIEQERYMLRSSQPNYNAMFSLVMAAWLNGHKVSVEYNTVRPVGGDSPFEIIEVGSIPDNEQ